METDKRCVLVLGGPAEEWISQAPSLRDDDFVTACDGGYPAAVQCGWRPRLAVGDFDSYRGEIASGVEVVTAPPEKDDTDAMLGAKLALERGFRQFLIVGAFGGRLDHTLANLQLLSWLRERGAWAQIVSGRNRAWLVQNETVLLPRLPGWHLSVFAWGGVCERVTLRGVAYPLTRYRMTPQLPIGVSNEFTEENARITAEGGTLLVVASREE